MLNVLRCCILPLSTTKNLEFHHLVLLLDPMLQANLEIEFSFLLLISPAHSYPSCSQLLLLIRLLLGNGGRCDCADESQECQGAFIAFLFVGACFSSRQSFELEHATSLLFRKTKKTHRAMMKIPIMTAPAAAAKRRRQLVKRRRQTTKLMLTHR